MKPTLMELDKKFDLKLIVSGTHLSKKHGFTIKEVKKSKLKIVERIKIPSDKNDLKSMADSIGFLIPRLTTTLQKIKPDLVLVEGDRGEQLAMSIASATMNIPIAHTSGGVDSRSIDDSFRNAITKFAHVHLAPTKKSAERIIKMNEKPWRVKLVGTPINLRYKKIDVHKQLGLKKNQILVVVLQHPITTQFKQAAKQMKVTLDAIKSLKFQSVVIYPNLDAGSNQMIKEIDKCRNLKFVKIFKNIENDLFMNLLNSADVIVGNSSAGIIEAPFFKLPVVNIGIRQENHSKSEVIKGSKKALSKKFRNNIRKNPYKIKGKTEKNISQVLSRIVINEKLLLKEPIF